MKYKRKPSELEAIQFFGEDTVIPEGIHVNLRKNEDGVWEVYNKLHDAWPKLKYGDFIRIDLLGDNYPIDQTYMKDNFYEVVD